MIKRNPAPEKILPGDSIVIVKEDERYKDLVHSKFIVLEIDPNREDGRILKLVQFNGNTIRHISAPEIDYWTKIDFVQVDKRTINGYDIYYETCIAKTIERNSENSFDWFDIRRGNRIISSS